MSKLTGKVAIVTGASKGIGAGIAKALAKEGASVVVNYSSGKDGADKVLAEISEFGGKAMAVQADMSKASDIKRLFAESHKAFGALDVLINNAGVFKFVPLEEITEEEFHRQFNINVLGPILATKESLSYFKKEGGSIVNISSAISGNPFAASSIYAGTKGALDVVTRATANELAPRKIRVNTIAPGGVETEGTHTLGMIGSDLEKDIVSKTPLGRMGQPEDIAKVAVFFASDDSAWITGERVLVSGGLV